MSKFLPIKAENPMALAILTQKIKYNELYQMSRNCNQCIRNHNIKRLNFICSFIGLEEMMDKSNKCSNSFPILDLGI